MDTRDAVEDNESRKSAEKIWNTIKQNKLKIFVSFLCLGMLICNLMIFSLLTDTNEKLEEHNRILLTVPDELNNAIVSIFEETANGMKKEIGNQVKDNIEEQVKSFDIMRAKQENDLSQVIERIKTTAEKKITDQDSEIHKSLTRQENNLIQTIEHIKTTAEKKITDQDSEILKSLTFLSDSISNIDKTTKANNQILSDVSTEDAKKTNAYLEAARVARKDNQDVARIMYVSALRHSQNKAPILLEIVNWYETLISTAIKEDDAALATSRLEALASICDNNIAMGSIEDMKEIQKLKQRLKVINDKIEGHTVAKASDQEKTLDMISKEVIGLSTYDDAEKLLQKINDITLEPSLDSKKDTIIADIIQRQSCLTSVHQDLLLPTVNEATPWVPWLENFIVRLKSDISTLKKLEDIGTAADILKIAKHTSIDGIEEKIKEVESVSRDIYMTYWQERVDQTLQDKKSDANTVSSLLTESNGFPQEYQKKFRKRIIGLNKKITKMMLDELTENLKRQKNIEKSVPAETFMQMVSATQGQCTQILLRLNALQGTYQNQFTNEINDISNKIDNLDKLLKSYRSKLAADNLRSSEEQRQKFVMWAKDQLDKAREYDDAGEAIAETWRKTRSDEEAVSNYIEAWRCLMRIHPGSLQAADPALYQTYSECKAKIENHWKPTDDERGKITYKRISDF